jgi:filamentous hemagglutinin family protein
MLQLKPQKPSRSLAAAVRQSRRPPVHTLVRVLAGAGVVSFLATAGLPPAFAQGLPSGMNVVHGRASAVVKGDQMTVTNSANAVLNWQAFSVGAGNQVRFDQPAATSRVLNRVVGNDASSIFGSISSNGQVWLVNPHGVLFGRDARVDVGSLVVSTLNLPLADWINGRGALSLSSVGGAGAEPIVNQGELRAASGGRIWLLGGAGGVRNEGLIAAPDGQVVLAAGRSVDLVDERLPNVAVRISAPGAEVLNLGSVTAGGGRVDLLSAVVNQSGIVHADGIGATGGVVQLAATESLQLAATSVTSADGADGGRVLLDAGPQGTLLAAGAVQALGDSGRGGEVQMLGRHVGLNGGAAIDASGTRGGGQVFVGGGLQGKDSSLRNAEAVYFGPSASVRADATDVGDGGRIILWSSEATRAYGSLSARGGAAGGDGGFIETSGGWLDARPATVRTDAPAGRTGEWLLDPYDLYIVSDPFFYGGPVLDDPANTFTSAGDDSVLYTGVIASALADNDVTITTGPPASPGVQAGDIFMGYRPDTAGPIPYGGDLLSFTIPVARSLTINAARDIEFYNSGIEALGDAQLTVNLISGRDIRLENVQIFGDDVPLTVKLDAVRDIDLAGTTRFESGLGTMTATLAAGGNISMRSISELYPSMSSSGGATVVSMAAPGGSITLEGADIVAADGALTVELSASGDIGLDNTGVVVDGAGPGNVTLQAVGNISIVNSSRIETLDGPLSINLSAGGDVGVLDFSRIGHADPGQPLTLSVDAAGTLTLRDVTIWAAGAPSSVVLQAGVAIEVDGSDGGSQIYMTGDTGLTLSASTITITEAASFHAEASGPISILADSFSTAGFTSIASDNGGTAIVLAGLSAPNIANFANSGTLDLAAISGGRWLVYLQGDGYTGSGLPGMEFFQYGMAHPSEPPLADGNGLVYSQLALLTLRNLNPITKPYDGSTGVTTADPGLDLDDASLRPGHTLGTGGLGDYVLSYGVPAPNVGTNIPIDVSGLVLPGISALDDYGGPIPVYGYTVQNTVRGDITVRQLTLSGVTAADKVYDGTRDAVLSGGSLVNVVGAETLTLTLTGGLFDTANAGAGKAVTGTALLSNGSGLASNYVLAADAVSTTADISRRPLSLTGVVAVDKVYDGTRVAQFSGASLANLVAGETLGLNSADALFDTANVGVFKTVTGTAALVDGTGLASNYELTGGAAVSTTGTISPRPLTLTGVQAADKVYDGTRDAVLSGGGLVNVVAGQTLGLALSGGLFDTANAGVDKPVFGTATLSDGTGSASNYVLTSPEVSAAADVTPAVLQYVADPQSVLLGQPLPPLTGQVTGFARDDRLDTATTGTLGFATDASPLALPGSYAIDGFGLAAMNYTFVQATGNARAMTIAAPPPTEAANELVRISDSLRTDPMLTLASQYKPGTMRTLDALQGWRMDSQGAAGSFGSIYLDAYSRSDLAALLAARSSYKSSVFAVGMKRLESDPTLADLPPCASMDEVDFGKCLVTDALVAQAESEEAAAGAGALPGVLPPVAPAAVAPSAALPPAPPPAPLPAPSPPPAVAVAPAVPPVSPAVAPSPPPAVAAAAAAPLVVRPKTVALTTAPPMPSLRPVRAAALPQIQRKIAVLVGLDNYVDERIPLLENAGRDVEAVARVLETQLGYQTVVVRDASREAIVGVLNRLALTARAHDSVIVYYAGHGTVVDATGLGYWIPASADAERPESWISNNDIGKLVGNIRASQVVLISDSCFSGSLVSDRRVTVAGAANDPSALLQRRAAVVMSSGGNEPVADGARNGHSPFAASLMQSLGQLENWRVGNTVFEQVRSDVTRRLPQTPQYGAARQGRHVEGADYVFEQRQLAQ